MGFSDVLKTLAFHHSGRPRGWVRSLMFTREREPKWPFSPLILTASGEPRPAFAPWLAQKRRVRSSAELDVIRKRRDVLVTTGALVTVRRIAIMTPPHTMFLADMIRTALQGDRLSVDIVGTAHDGPYDLFIVISPPFFLHLPDPEKRVVFQVEQSVSERWFTEGYLDTLQSSLAVLDYSQHNLRYLAEKGVPLADLFYLPISPIPDYAAQKSVPPAAAYADRPYDVLFYGDATAQRRKDLLAVLTKHFRCRVETNLFGPALLEAIGSAVWL